MGLESKGFITERIILVVFCLSVIIPLILLRSLINFKPAIYNDKSKFDSISELNKEDLTNINNFEQVKLQLNIMDHLSLVFAKFARYPYYKDENFNNKKFLNFDVINYGVKSENNYFVTFKNDDLQTVVIAFPGTLQPPQLIDEALGSKLINFDEKINNKILIGKYFGERALSLLDLIFNEELNKLIKKGYQIISTGHSLGGAMAQCFMYFALSKGKIEKKNIPITITYGQPKAGNIYFAHFLDNNAFLNLRLINKNDLVQYIPFCSGVINHIFYFLGKLDNVNIYAHTSIEINQHNMCNLPNILYFFFIIIKIVIFIIKLIIFISPMYTLFWCLLKIYSIWNEIQSEYKIYYYLVIFLVLIACFFKFEIPSIYKKYSLMAFIIWLLIFLLLSIIILFVVIVCFVQLICLICYMIRCCFNKFEDENIRYIKDHFDIKIIFKIIYLAISSIYEAIIFCITILPHLSYQLTKKEVKKNEKEDNPLIKDTVDILYKGNYNIFPADIDKYKYA